MRIKTRLEINQKSTPSFEEGDVVKLKEDCYSYSICADFDSHLKKK